MKRHPAHFVLVACTLLLAPLTLRSAEKPTTPTYEYATIRWGGRDNTHVIRPGAEVEFVGGQLKRFKKPERTDERSFYMNVVVNGMAKEGWEVSAMTPDDIILRRLKD